MAQSNIQLRDVNDYIEMGPGEWASSLYLESDKLPTPLISAQRRVEVLKVMLLHYKGLYPKTELRLSVEDNNRIQERFSRAEPIMNRCLQTLLESIEAEIPKWGFTLNPLRLTNRYNESEYYISQSKFLPMEFTLLGYKLDLRPNTLVTNENDDCIEFTTLSTLSSGILQTVVDNECEAHCVVPYICNSDELKSPRATTSPPEAQSVVPYICNSDELESPRATTSPPEAQSVVPYICNSDELESPRATTSLSEVQSVVPYMCGSDELESPRATTSLPFSTDESADEIKAPILNLNVTDSDASIQCLREILAFAEKGKLLGLQVNFNANCNIYQSSDSSVVPSDVRVGDHNTGGS
ncbi:hypothetical protein SERLADRAFT_437627 [Serpula lacrymans var. lacrymans S7.9]|uniref:Uncharacterized protein n=1 Tax=Serpula lacrymans var. lacrymans (strain S7.9) TaxID=578457 RepID=F8NUQ3_SERL9|nr:uncharacterized protein SERLADRAFT_437627 [Serpula lacrymans var. lacrymans S7.9]EGO25911.1 hypothetical protein SERLADRAFT_437627 [Serpula lacrymans var. lacrymans S7.9]